MTDIHAHYDDAKFDGDREELLASLSYMKIINAGCDRISSEKARALAEKYENIYFTAGVHPEYAAVCGDFESWLVPLLSHPKCVGIGEIGLDYHYDEPPRDIQKEIFNRQLYLAVKYGKPVVIHDRDAHADSVDAVLAHRGVRGVFHSFSGSAETAKILRRAGLCISFSGVVTFKNAVKTVEVCRTVDDGGFMVETDCPYLAPTPFRGKRNDSSLTKYTAERIAEIRGVSPEEIERLTDANAAALFGI